MNKEQQSKKYVVTLWKQHPAWNEKDGIRFELEAISKADAIKQARREADYGGITGTGMGRYWFKAVEANQ